jgi:hypothetical protein
MATDQGQGPGVRPLTAIGAAWLLSVGFDLFLHAGLLARLYSRPSDFLLPAGDAFRRIPLGYGAFFILTWALYWLFRRLGIADALQGARLGSSAGLVLWGAWCLGLYSIAVAEPDLLVGWWLGQAAELGLAGAVLGAAAGGMTTGRLVGRVAVAFVLFVIGAVVLQNVGWAPPMTTVGGI